MKYFNRYKWYDVLVDDWFVRIEHFLKTITLPEFWISQGDITKVDGSRLVDYINKTFSGSLLWQGHREKTEKNLKALKLLPLTNAGFFNREVQYKENSQCFLILMGAWKRNKNLAKICFIIFQKWSEKSGNTFVLDIFRLKHRHHH